MYISCTQEMGCVGKCDVLGTFPEHRKDGYHMVREPIRR